MVIWISKHHPNISLKKDRNLSIARAMGANPTVISQWYSLLKEVMHMVDITSPEQIWSGDETGIQNVLKEIKVLGYKKIRTFQQVSSEQGETSTVLSFISAVGNLVPPLVIHNRQHVQDSWKIKAPGNVQLGATTKGYIMKLKFHQYGLHIYSSRCSHIAVQVGTELDWISIGRMLIYIHSHQRNEICENYS